MSIWQRWGDRVAAAISKQPGTDPADVVFELMREMKLAVFTVEDPVLAVERDLPTDSAAESWWAVALRLHKAKTEASSYDEAIRVARLTYLHRVRPNKKQFTAQAARLAVKAYEERVLPLGRVENPPARLGLDWVEWCWSENEYDLALEHLRALEAAVLTTPTSDFLAALDADRPPLVAAEFWWSVLFDRVAQERWTKDSHERLLRARSAYLLSLREQVITRGRESFAVALRETSEAWTGPRSPRAKASELAQLTGRALVLLSSFRETDEPELRELAGAHAESLSTLVASLREVIESAPPLAPSKPVAYVPSPDEDF